MTTTTKTGKKGAVDKSIEERLANLSPKLQEILDELESYLHSLGEDVQRKDLKLYIAFKRIRNFATAVPKDSFILLYLHVDPKDYPAIDGFSRDVTQIGHWGTGNLEIPHNDMENLAKAKPYLEAAYNGEGK